MRNSGVSITDTAGLIAPGTNSPSYHENGGGGGLSGTYDASRFVGPNQHLFFNGAFDYTNSSTNFGGVGAGSSINRENYNFTEPRSYSNYKYVCRADGLLSIRQQQRVQFFKQQYRPLQQRRI